MTKREWLKSPPEHAPFYPCWVLGRDDFIFLSSWRDGEWKIGKGIAADASEITHYQFLQAPPPPTNQMNSEKNEVIYADL